MATGGLTGLIRIMNKQLATVWIWKKRFQNSAIIWKDNYSWSNYEKKLWAYQ